MDQAVNMRPQDYEGCRLMSIFFVVQTTTIGIAIKNAGFN
jgi:hypothetical protein